MRRQPTCRKAGFSLVELLTVMAILAIMMGVLLPVISSARQAAYQASCASNLRQIGAALTVYYQDHGNRLPARPAGLEQANPHVFRYRTMAGDISDVMEHYAGSREVYYCPANYQRRTPDEWWAFQTGTIASTYQFPFLLKQSMWLIPVPDYSVLKPDRVLAADYLGTDINPRQPLAWNHNRSGDGSPIGMNQLFGDGHVQWSDRSIGWKLWGRSGGPVDWYLTKE